VGTACRHNPGGHTSWTLLGTPFVEALEEPYVLSPIDHPTRGTPLGIPPLVNPPWGTSWTPVSDSALGDVPWETTLWEHLRDPIGEPPLSDTKRQPGDTRRAALRVNPLRIPPYGNPISDHRWGNPLCGTALLEHSSEKNICSPPQWTPLGYPYWEPLLGDRPCRNPL
jgi:hypothetical protein